MRTSTGCASGALALCLVAWALSPLTASAEAASASIIHEHPDRACRNDAATLVWSRPEGVADLTGYRITQLVITASTPQSSVTSVGPEQTSLPFTVPFGMSTFQIWSVTAAGVASAPFASASIMGNQAPTPMAWDTTGPSAVGDGTATVPFKWYNPKTWSASGGVLPATVAVTASPGGARIDSTVTGGASSVAPTFTGLTNGVSYKFTAVTSNACGTSGPSDSPTYIVGVPPAWTQASPPLTVPKNKTYSYEFVASGTPAPRYVLLDAPEWLELGPGGLVTGDPPKETTSFSYAIVAIGAGWEPSFGFVYSGRFTVEVTRGWRGPH